MRLGKKLPFIPLITFTMILCLATALQAADPPKVERVGESVSLPDKLVIGEAEYIAVPAIDAVFDARIDTGATTTSIYATDVEEFERDGKPWVRFVVQNPDAEKTYPMELPVARIAMIKKRGQEGETRRPAVALDLTMGKVTRLVEVNLADRTGFEYPLLIGRDFLRDVAVVDVTKKYTQATPGAPEPETNKED